MKTKIHKIVIFLLIITFLVFNLYIFPKFQVLNNVHNLNPLDLRLSYNVSDVSELFTILGAEGRTQYAYFLRNIDSVYPLVYGLLFISIILFYQQKRMHYKSIAFGLFLFPIVSVIFDLLENSNTLKILTQYPTISSAFVEQGSFFTMAKWSFVLASIVAVILLFVFDRIKNYPKS